GPLQIRVREPELAKSEGGVDHFGLHTVEIHILEAFRRVPTARPRVLVGGRLEEPGKLLRFLAGPHALREMDGRDAFQHEIGAGPLPRRILHHARGAVPEGPVDALDPQIAGLVDVGIGGDQRELAHDPPPWRTKVAVAMVGNSSAIVKPRRSRGLRLSSKSRPSRPYHGRWLHVPERK